MYMCTYIHFIPAQKYVCMYMQYPEDERAYSNGENVELFLVAFNRGVEGGKNMASQQQSSSNF